MGVGNRSYVTTYHAYQLPRTGLQLIHFPGKSAKKWTDRLEPNSATESPNTDMEALCIDGVFVTEQGKKVSMLLGLF